MMGGGAQMCEPVVPPTAKGKEHQVKLMILGFIHLALAIAYCFILPMQGLYEIIDVLILFCALAQMNYCCLIIYLINITINFFISFNQLGLWVQTGNATKQMEEASFGQSVAIAVIIGLTIYYIVANVFCFYAYREFKGMLVDHQVANGGGGMGGGLGMGGMMGGSGPQNAQRVNQERAENNYPAPGGRHPGPPNNSAAASGGGGGGFKSFQGKGVQIGGS